MKLKTPPISFSAVVVLVGFASGIFGQDYPGATWMPAASANVGVANRTASDVRWVIIHTTEGTTASAVQRFQDPSQIVSAHYIISRDGSIIQMVLNKDVAYAAGNLAYNNASINIEHERYGTSNWTEAQFIASVNLVKWLAQRYNFTVVFPSGIQPANPASGAGIIGHIQVPDPYNPSLGGGASHHTDPVNWDWVHYQSLFTLPDTTAPTIVIDFPPNNATTTSSSIAVTGAASDAGRGDNGVSSVTVNGISASGGTAGGLATANWSATVTLSPGANTIKVVAKDYLNNAATNQISVTYNPSPTHTLTVASVNPAAAVTMSVSPSDNHGVSSGVTPLTLTYTQNTLVTVTSALVVNGGPFRKYKLDGTNAATSFVFDVTMDRDHTATAVFGSLAAQTITFPYGPLPNRTIGEPPFQVFASASSGLPVSFSVTFGPATSSGTLGSTITITNTGVVVVLAMQNGDLDYDPVTSAGQAFTIFAPPVLGFTRSGNNLIATWPTNVGGYDLQITSSLLPPVSWSLASPLFVVGGKYTVTNAISNGGGFLRLRKEF